MLPWISPLLFATRAPVEGLVPLATYAPNAATWVDISATYLGRPEFEQFWIGYNVRPSGNDSEIFHRTSVDNGTTIPIATADYTWSQGLRNTTGADSDGGLNAGILLAHRGSGNGIDAGSGISGMLYVKHLGSASRYPTFGFHSLYRDDTFRPNIVNGCGFRLAAAKVNFIRLLPSAGSTFSGVVTVHGVLRP